MDSKPVKKVKIVLGIIGVLMIATGVLVFCIPDSVSWIVGIMLFIVGLANIVLFAKDGRNLIFSGLFLTDGIMDILFGAMFCWMSRGITTILTVLLAVMLIMLGFGLLATTGVVRKLSKNKAWIGMLVLGIAAIILGIVSVANPGAGGIGQTVFAISIAIILILMGVGYFVLIHLLNKAAKKDTDENVEDYYRDVT